MDGRLTRVRILGSILVCTCCGCHLQPQTWWPPEHVEAPGDTTSLTPVPLPPVETTPEIPQIQQVSYQGPIVEGEIEPLSAPLSMPGDPQPPARLAQRRVTTEGTLLPASESALKMAMDEANSAPIDLANALALGGASNLTIRLAREKICEAYADYLRARVAWLPSLRLGIGYNKHDGRLQATEGSVIEAGRNSLFVGGGAGLGTAPLAAGASGPGRLFVNLSVADAIFEPMIACRLWHAESAAEDAVMNDELLGVAEAYFSLVEAYGLLADARLALNAANELVQVTELFVRGGGGSQVDADRARAQQKQWERAVQEAERIAWTRNIDFATRVRLDPTRRWVPAEEAVLPIFLIDSTLPLEAMMAQGWTTRPELRQHRWIIDAALQKLCEEKWRPWLPHVQVGATGGTFGGGPSAEFENQGSRSDVDLLAVWELQNLGLGNRALQRISASRVSQARFAAERVRDSIAAEVATAAADTAAYSDQIETARRGIKAAEQSYQRNLERVRAQEGLPLELLEAIRTRANAHDTYTRAVSDFNRAQFRLLRAMGAPPRIPAEVATEIPSEPIPEGRVEGNAE